MREGPTIAVGGIAWMGVERPSEWSGLERMETG